MPQQCARRHQTAPLLQAHGLQPGAPVHDLASPRIPPATQHTHRARALDRAEPIAQARSVLRALRTPAAGSLAGVCLVRGLKHGPSHGPRARPAAPPMRSLPRWVGARSVMGWWDSSAAPTLAFWVRFPSGRPRAKRAWVLWGAWVLRRHAIGVPAQQRCDSFRVRRARHSQWPQGQSWSDCGQGTSTAVASSLLLSTHPPAPLSSSPTSLLTISPSPAFTVRGGQTHPHRPRLVVSFSTCPSSPPPPPPGTRPCHRSSSNKHTIHGFRCAQRTGPPRGREGRSRRRGGIYIHTVCPDVPAWWGRPRGRHRKGFCVGRL